MTKMPEPTVWEYASYEGWWPDPEPDGYDVNKPIHTYTADQLKQYGRDLLEEAAKKCVASDLIDMPTTVEIAAVRKCLAAIRAMKETI